jgi:hypothetical protein
MKSNSKIIFVKDQDIRMKKLKLKTLHSNHIHMFTVSQNKEQNTPYKYTSCMLNVREKSICKKTLK